MKKNEVDTQFEEDIKQFKNNKDFLVFLFKYLFEAYSLSKPVMEREETHSRLCRREGIREVVGYVGYLASLDEKEDK